MVVAKGGCTHSLEASGGFSAQSLHYKTPKWAPVPRRSRQGRFCNPSGLTGWRRPNFHIPKESSKSHWPSPNHLLPISSRLFQPVTKAWQKPKFHHFPSFQTNKQMLACPTQSSDQGKIHKSCGRLRFFCLSLCLIPFLGLPGSGSKER